MGRKISYLSRCSALQPSFLRTVWAYLLNLTAVQSLRGVPLAREKTSLKIDGAAALSFAVAAAEKYDTAAETDESYQPAQMKVITRRTSEEFWGPFRPRF